VVSCAAPLQAVSNRGAKRINTTTFFISTPHTYKV
jgi:hypothetical protein